MSQVHEEFEMQQTKPEAVRDELREAMPATAASKDLFVRLFGEGVRIVYAEEGDLVIKTKRWQPDTAYRAALTPTQFMRLGVMGDEYFQAMTEAKANGK
jgi:hypothetical protein